MSETFDNVVSFWQPLGVDALRTLMRLVAGNPACFFEESDEAGTVFGVQFDFIPVGFEIVTGDDSLFQPGVAYHYVVVVDHSEPLPFDNSERRPTSDSVQRCTHMLRGFYKFCLQHRSFDYDEIKRLLDRS